MSYTPAGIPTRQLMAEEETLIVTENIEVF